MTDVEYTFMSRELEENARTDKYKEYLEEKYKRKLEYLYVEEDGEYVNLHYRFEPIPFERIRRITGYLTGTTNSWNNAKQEELKDRVKHL